MFFSPCFLSPLKEEYYVGVPCSFFFRSPLNFVILMRTILTRFFFFLPGCLLCVTKVKSFWRITAAHNPLKLEVVYPQNGTAGLKGSRIEGCGGAVS